MDQYTVTVADRIRFIPPGKSALITGSTLATVRSTGTRVSRKTGAKFVSRPEGDGVRIWRVDAGPDVLRAARTT